MHVYWESDLRQASSLAPGQVSVERERRGGGEHQNVCLHSIEKRSRGKGMLGRGLGMLGELDHFDT